MPSADENRPTKRKRLSHACNYCRSQKKRCDEEKPSCRKCIAAGQVCITTNPRRPGAPEVERYRAGDKDRGNPANSPPSSLTQCALPNSSPSISPPPSQDTHHSQRETSSHEGRQTVPPQFRISDKNKPHSAISREPELPGRNRESTTEPPLSSPPPRLQNLDPATHSNASHRAQPTPTSWPTHSNFVISQETPLYTDMHSAVNSDENNLRKKYLGASSLQVFAQWVDLVLMSHGSTERLSDGFRYGMRHAEEFDLPLSVSLPSISSLNTIQPCLEVFLDRINPLYPFVDEQFLNQTLEKFKRHSDFTRIPRADIPELATLYAVLSVGIAELNGYGDLVGKTLLDAAYSLLSHIIAYPYLSSIQALGVIAISLRGRLRDGAASQIAGQAVRIAHSIGLHRGDISPTEPHAAVYERVWCACYCLEKNIQFDSGRPSEVFGDFTGLGLISTYDPEPHYAHALLGLSQIQGRINRDIFSLKGVQKSPQDLLPILAEIDAELMAWTDGVSQIIRPGREFIICPTNMLPPATFLALQYYSTLAMIHRTSLLVDEKVHQSVIESTSLSTTAKHRLLAGESICVNAARSIVRCVNDMLARYGPSQLLSPQPPLLAVYILVIHTMRHPHAWHVESDLNLIQKIASTTESLYLLNGQHSRFAAMCSKLYTLATMIVSKATDKSSRVGKSTGDTRVASDRHQRFSSAAEEDTHGSRTLQSEHISRNRHGYNLRRVDGTTNTHPSTWSLESESESNNHTVRHHPMNPGEVPAVLENRCAPAETNGSRAVHQTIYSQADVTNLHSVSDSSTSCRAPHGATTTTTSSLVFSPNTIDRLWTTTLSDNLSFPYPSQMAYINSNSHLHTSPPSAAPDSSFLHAEEERQQSTGLQQTNPYYFGTNIFSQENNDNNNHHTEAAASQPQQLLSPTATSYRDHRMNNQSWTLPEACHLFGVPWLYDLGPDLHLLYDDTAEESGLGSSIPEG